MASLKNKVMGISNPAAFACAVFGLIILIFAFSFLCFTFGYWLVTLILAGFFGFILPFSWWYSLGAWLIGIIATLFLLPARVNVNS